MSRILFRKSGAAWAFIAIVTTVASLGAAGAQTAAAPEPKAVYSPWVKLCGKNPRDPDAKELCQTMKELHKETGQFVAGAALIELSGAPKKKVQLILPTRLLLAQLAQFEGSFCDFARRGTSRINWLGGVRS